MKSTLDKTTLDCAKLYFKFFKSNLKNLIFLKIKMIAKKIILQNKKQKVSF
jgi:hypothetical protein